MLQVLGGLVEFGLLTLGDCHKLGFGVFGGLLGVFQLLPQLGGLLLRGLGGSLRCVELVEQVRESRGLAGQEGLRIRRCIGSGLSTAAGHKAAWSHTIGYRMMTTNSEPRGGA